MVLAQSHAVLYSGLRRILRCGRNRGKGVSAVPNRHCNHALTSTLCCRSGEDAK